MFRWPTSELPIWPSGSPTSPPEVCRKACGQLCHSRSKFGLRAWRTALSADFLAPAEAVEDHQHHRPNRLRHGSAPLARRDWVAPAPWPNKCLVRRSYSLHQAPAGYLTVEGVARLGGEDTSPTDAQDAHRAIRDAPTRGRCRRRSGIPRRAGCAACRASPARRARVPPAAPSRSRGRPRSRRKSATATPPAARSGRPVPGTAERTRHRTAASSGW